MIVGTLSRVWSAWKFILRLTIGLYWLYFSGQKWFDYNWVKPVLDQAAQSNPIPAIGNLLWNFVLPNWEDITRLQTILEATVGVLLVIGLLTRIAGLIGAVLATGLMLTFLGSLDAPLVFWFYVLSAATSFTVAISDGGKVFGIDGLLAKKWPNPRLPFW